MTPGLLLAGAMVLYLYGMGLIALLQTRHLRRLAQTPPTQLCASCQDHRITVLAGQHASPARTALALGVMHEALIWPWTLATALVEDLRGRAPQPAAEEARPALDRCTCGTPIT
ncbi:hypothetical protein [Streptomonospora litoralis]|uniref:Uncharacterized protein n=1 Tax=Streptomonospora litoralis TaxID=2498135 RepID=A0A4P6Q3R6_9ACTN|nr:hypothetical protein [Streptomonospora litoralis]QBI53464.1 hypothetical protein EKD16_08350 [Streptomonospora litoralis]